MNRREIWLVPFALLLLAAPPLHSQPALAGPEITLTAPDGPSWASVVSHPEGTFTVLWEAGLSLRAQRFDARSQPLGGEMSLGRSSGFGAAAVGSGFVVVGLDDAAVYPRALGQIFDSSGAPQRARFFVDLATAPALSAPKVAAAPDGGFSVVWVGREPGLGRAVAFLRRFNAAGVSQGRVLRLADPARSGGISDADVVRAPDGRLLVTGFGSGPWYAAGQLIAPSGEPLGPPFPLGDGEVHQPLAAAFTPDGGLLAVWLGDMPELPGNPGVRVSGIFGRLYDAAGRPRGGAFTLELAVPGVSLAAPVLAADGEGRLFAAWSSSALELRVVEIGPGGTLGPILARPVSFHTGTPLAIAAWGDGNLAVAWGKHERSTWNDLGLGVQRFAAGVSPGVLRLESGLIAGLEGTGTFVARVERREGNRGTVSARYALRSNVARPGDDYFFVPGTVTFADGESNPKSIVVQVLDDPLAEGTETLLLTLSEPAGGATLGAPLRARIEIRDDDTPSPLLGAAPAAFDIESGSGGSFEHFGDPQVAALGHGRFVAVWNDWPDRFQVIPYFAGQVYDVDGQVIAGRPWLSNSAMGVRLAPRPDGGFIVTGYAFNILGLNHVADLGSVGQQFDRAGQPLSSPFPLPFTPAAIAAGRHGDLLALTGAPNVFLYRFGKHGLPLGSALPVTSSGGAAALAADSRGRGVVAWTEGSPGSRRLFVRRLDAEGRWLGAAVVVDPLLERQPAAIALAVAPDGRFVVVWEGMSDGDGLGIFGRRFDPSGAPAGPVLQVNSETAGDQSAPRVAMQGDGRFLVIWQVGATDPIPRIHGQYYTADGRAMGSEALLSGEDDGPESGAALACDAQGRYTLVWRRPDITFSAIRARRFVAP
jgi:hypothetical protein